MKKVIKSFPKFSGLLTAGSNKVTEIGAAGGRYELRNYFRLFFEVGFILRSSIFSKNCFRSRSFGFFFFNFRCDERLVGTSETRSSFLWSMLIKKVGKN